MTIFEIKIKTSVNKSTTLSYTDKGDDLANIIHKDDTIHTLKQKIAYKMKDEGISANELYIFYEARDYYDYIKAENQMLNIKDQLKSILGDKLSLNFKVDKKIIGGLIIKVGSKMIDTSLANKINKLKIAMKGA